MTDILVPNLQYVEFCNYDSIFVLLKARDFVYDSALFLMNFKGEIKKNYSLKGAPVFSLENDYRQPDSVAYISNIYYSENKLFLFFNKLFFEYINDSAYNSVEIPLSGHINLDEDVFYKHNIYNYPDLEKDKQYHESNTAIFPFFKDNILYYSFVYTPKIVKYNILDNTVDSVSIKSSLLDSIKLTKERKAFENGKAYLDLDYLPEYEVYIRQCLLEDNPTFKVSGIILDENFNKLGEFVFPKNTSITANNISNNKIYCYDRDKTYSTDKKIIFSEYSLSKKEMLLSDLIKEKSTIENDTNKTCKTPLKEEFYIDKEYLENYLSNLTGKKDFKAVVVPIFGSCHSCVDYILEIFSINLSYYQQNNVFLMAVGDNFPAIKEKLKQFGVSYEYPNVILDSSSNYVNAFRNYSTEHLIIVKSGKITFAKDYYPAELSELSNKMMEE